MKTSSITLLFTIAIEGSAALLVLPNFVPKPVNRFLPQQQDPILSVPNIQMPPLNDKDSSSGGTGDLSISDVIGKERIINIFASFTRDVDSISKRLDDNTKNTTVLAPLNSELQKLPRKPWEDPKDYAAMGAQAYDGADGEDRATSNLRRFVEAHTVPVSPWKEGEKVKSLQGETIWWEDRGGTKTVHPGNIEVASIASRVSNGEVWVLRGCMNYE